MWVAARGDHASALHRFQLVSGRLLQTFHSPADAGAVQFSAVAVAADAVYVLDASGRRIFVLTAGDKAVRDFAALPDTIAPIGLTRTGTALLVSHATGILRVDLASRQTRPVTTPAAVEVTDLHSLAWHQGALFAIQKHPGGAQVVRVRLNARGTAVTTVDVLQRSAGTAATLAGEAYYFLMESPGEGQTIRSVPVAK
jgi:hypothetical protein